MISASAQTPSAILFQGNFSEPVNGWIATKKDYAEFSFVEGEYRILLSKPKFNTYSYLPNKTFSRLT